MKKFILAGLLAFFACQANAGFIQGVTGEDMVGVEVTATFADGASETATWAAITTGAGGAFGILPWGVLLDGDSFGEYDPLTDTLYGGFLMMNFYDFDMVSLSFSALSAGFVFDTAFFDASANGSGSGRELAASNPDVFAVYSDNYMDELYGTMTLLSSSQVVLASGEMGVFLTDTDQISEEVPAPAGFAMIALALMGMRLARKSSK
ncbi:hypothetical protein FJ444_20095 [Aestuariibacter sp. GS-14]|jgi:hypothetical protein|uniref:hypothetical protein n=1 Tax=Aestuariibacter sp. GS-14 TaxID=2590670 RepID=UPI001128329C|nr:hypothetical protein [Aestuariibacter sp. GS-14]TPV53833.1 hypothetical protein FJ444_20095 [Aestuariibacter sp. GS-14]